MASSAEQHQQAAIARFQELKAAFDRKDIFGDEVNEIRARTLAIATLQRRRREDESKIGSHQMEGHQRVVSLLREHTSKHGGDRRSHGRRSPAATASQPLESQKNATLPSGLQCLQERLQFVDEAATVAQAKGIPIEMELQSRQAAAERQRDSNTIVSGTSGTTGIGRRAQRGPNTSVGGGSFGHPAKQGGRKASNFSGPVVGRQRGTGGNGNITSSARLDDTDTTAPSSPTPTFGLGEGGAGNNSLLDISSQVPRAVERGTLAPSEWLQLSCEHMDYPDAERQVRDHLKRRDDAKRSHSAIDRYTVPFQAQLHEKERMWADQSAKVSIAIIAPDPLQRIASPPRIRNPDLDDDEPRRKKDQVQRASSPIQRPLSTSTKPASRPQQATPDAVTDSIGVFERMTDRNQFLKLARSTKRARRVYEDVIAKELLAAANMLGPHVPVLSNAPDRHRQKPKPGAAKAPTTASDDEDCLSFSSSDSSENDEDARGAAEKEGIRYLGEDAGVSLVPGVRLPSTDASTENMQDVAELVECAVVCLCQNMSGVRNSVTREQVVLRTILIHALSSGLPLIRGELARREAFIGLATTAKNAEAPPPQGPVEAALICRLLRSWTKGIEVLLSNDLGTISEERIPFSIHNDAHVQKLVQHYCRLHETKDERIDRLMERWRQNKEEADSAILAGDSAKTLLPPTRNQQKAVDLVHHFSQLACVTTDDLSRLDDHQAQSVLGRQQELAQHFLDRVSKYLPLPNPDGKSPNKLREEEAGTIREEDLMLRRSPPTLRHVLLHYSGLLKPSTVLHNTPTSSDSFQFSAPDVSVASVSRFLNVFRSTWGRTPLSADIGFDEANDRSTTIQNGTFIQLLDCYFHLLSPLLQDQIRSLVKAEKQRWSAVKAKMTADSDALRKALGAFGPIPPTPSEARAQAHAAESKAALEIVEHHHLVEKYSRPSMDSKTVERLRRTVESSEAWFGYEQSRRAARMGSNTSSTWHEQADGSDATSKSPSPSNAGPAGSSPTKNSRMELVRMKKLQELEALWHRLGMGYSIRVALHDKWNHPTRELRHIEGALKMYRECIVAVEAREAAYKAVLDNEALENKTQKMSSRHALITTLCTAGQRCELLAKKLFNETGDELRYKNDVLYVAKLNEEFAHISQTLRS